MKYRQLGRTDLNVSLICLGTMTWGQQNSEAEAHGQLDYALSRGVNFIDTAEMYPTPPTAETQGRTEAYIGSWLEKRKNRGRVIIASKVCGAADWIDYLRGGDHRLDRNNIEAAVDASLKRLRTDYIDLYQVHWPDRDTNFFGRLNYYHAPEKDNTPIAETLAVLDDLVKAGKIRYIGVSNETPWGLHEYLRHAELDGKARVVSIQNPYNLLNRTFETGLAEFAHREQIGLLAYSPLAFGSLSGKYLNGARPAGARLTLFQRFSRYTNAQGLRATEKYVALARQQGLEPVHMALAFVNSRPFLGGNIIGATSIEQLQTDIASIDVELSKELMKAIEEIHTEHPNPCP